MNSLAQRSLASVSLAVLVAGLPCCGQTSASDEPAPAQPNHASLLGKPDLKVQDASNDLTRSRVTAYLDTEMASHESMLWCATMWKAWDSMSELMHAPFQVGAGPNEPEPEMSAHLRALVWDPALLDQDSYLAMAGYGPTIVEQIKAELKKKFGGAASPSILPEPSSLPPDGILAYSYLFKNLQFEHPFDRSDRGLFFSPSADPSAPHGSLDPVIVQAFGLSNQLKDWSAVASQIIVHDYASPQDFVVELKTKDADDRLIIARLTPGKTLKETVDQAMTRAKADQVQPGVTKDEQFMVPVLNFDVTRQYHEIIRKRVATPGFTDYRVANALQNIRFRLDEKGAILKSEAFIMLDRAMSPRTPRRFVCDGPFLIVMAQANADTPYVAAWIANDELLVKHN
ncbi:MAG: hypothetical protein AB7G11_09575 [Phycisphaerales bacterium]